MPDRAPTHRPPSTQRRRPEVETLAFHPRPDADGGLVARLDNGVLVPPHPADADRVTPGEAWTCTLAEGPDGDTVARLVARVEPAPPPLDEEAGDSGDSDADGAGPDTRGALASSSRSRHRDPAGPDLHPGEREQLERRRQELRQRAELLLAQLEEVHDRLGDVEDALEG